MYLIPVIIILVVHFAVIYPFYLIPNNDIGISALQPSRFSFTINWTLFSVGTYLIFYIIKFILMKITPSLKQYISNEINNLGYKIDEKNRSLFSFLILNSIAVLILFLIELRIINFNIIILNNFSKGFFICYLFLAVFIPVLWRLFYDGLRVKLIYNYQIYINPYFRIRKSKSEDYQLIHVYLTSNRIAYKFNNAKKERYNKIAESRWLPRKKRSFISKYRFSPFLRFYEFSTPSNIQKPFLNIALALQEWDNQNKKLI